MTGRGGYPRFGKIDGSDYEQFAPLGKARVRLSDKSPGILTKPLQVVMPFAGVDKAYFMPKVGDPVCVLLDEHAEDGVILGSLYTKQTTPPVDTSDKHHILWDDGCAIEYDKANHRLSVDIPQGELALDLRGNGIFKILCKGEETDPPQLLIETDGKLKIGVKEDFELWGDKSILIDAKGNINLVADGTINQSPLRIPPRDPYFTGQSDPYFDS